ncbi:hypothetical protein TNIN_79281 [Trichonephila inaurata madagascariensis]|uniref:Uncharacterized protein n=1 Tax=Trichonephila inaurata madagascariensis TaxID=2747483 RepID=A0A8X7CFZ1_9ARAC|nr:hypothetical protein TNIN_79281 [Trichonephila inaurata madagascariensis]
MNWIEREKTEVVNRERLQRTMNDNYNLGPESSVNGPVEVSAVLVEYQRATRGEGQYLFEHTWEIGKRNSRNAQKVYKDETLTSKNVNEGWSSLEDAPRAGQPKTTRKPENIERGMIEVELGIGTESVHLILTEDLGKLKLSSRKDSSS